MESFTTKFIAAALLTLTCLACDLEFRCTGTDGNYVIVNPDSTTYTGVQAYHENGTECGTTVNGTQSGTFTVCECGLNNIQVDLVSSEGTTSCTISCEDGTRSQRGYSLPLNFILQPSGVLRPGSAHYYCHDTNMVFVRNPRKTVYFDSVAYSYAGDQLSCYTNHILGNQVVEVSGCDTSSGVVLELRKNSNTDFLIRRQSDIFFLDCGAPSPAVDTGNSGDTTYDCYEDGTIVFNNPRRELFQYSWAEQNGVECMSFYVKDKHQAIITNCDYELIYLVKSEGFHQSDSTREPESHLPEFVVNNYTPQDIDHSSSPKIQKS